MLVVFIFLLRRSHRISMLVVFIAFSHYLSSFFELLLSIIFLLDHVRRCVLRKISTFQDILLSRSFFFTSDFAWGDRSFSKVRFASALIVLN